MKIPCKQCGENVIATSYYRCPLCGDDLPLEHLSPTRAKIPLGGVLIVVGLFAVLGLLLSPYRELGMVLAGLLILGAKAAKWWGRGKGLAEGLAGY
jgi:hypothetical protein